MEQEKYGTVPGRGLVTQKGIDLRLEHLAKLDLNCSEIRKTGLNHYDLQHNIESFVGSVEIPLGLVGPLYMQKEGTIESVYCVAGTLELFLITVKKRLETFIFDPVIPTKYFPQDL